MAAPRVLALLLLLTALALSGCSSSPKVAASEVMISDFKFEPATLSVPAGSVVHFMNHGSATHTSTATGGAFDTGNIPGGGSADVHLDHAGTFTYKCSIHSSMTGTITVT